MPRLRSLFLLLLLCGFLFRWDTEQFVMWAEMVQKAPAGKSLSQAMTDALSGAKPCPKCHRLTAEKTADTEADALVATETAPGHLILSGSPRIPLPACSPLEYTPFTPNVHNRPTSAPLLPPPILNT
jgi:hypothetical protein